MNPPAAAFIELLIGHRVCSGTNIKYSGPARTILLCRLCGRESATLYVTMFLPALSNWKGRLCYSSCYPPLVSWASEFHGAPFREQCPVWILRSLPRGEGRLLPPDEGAFWRWLWSWIKCRRSTEGAGGDRTTQDITCHTYVCVCV